VYLTVPSIQRTNYRIREALTHSAIMFGIVIFFTVFFWCLEGPDDGVPSMWWLLLGGVGLAAVIFLLDAANRAWQHAILGVVGDTLVVREMNLLRTRQRRWPRQRIADIRVGPSVPREVSDPELLQAALDQLVLTWDLQIHLKGDTIVHLLDDYGEKDLQWVATVLRRALRVPDRATS
jgi:hypothetical protein